jgi:hypothetical protein
MALRAVSPRILGTTTNNNAAAGEIGEFISSEVLSGSAVSLTTATPANVTSISLTAGDWDVWAQVGFLPAATTSITNYQGGINTVSATLPSSSAVDVSRLSMEVASVVTGANAQCFHMVPARISLAGTTTIYFIARATFTISTCVAFGKIVARRAR